MIDSRENSDYNIFMVDLSVSEENGFTPEMIERFELVLLFRQIATMLEKYYEKDEAGQMIEAMIYSQDKIRYEGINRFDNEFLKKFMFRCRTCKEITFHHILSSTKECSVCGTHRV